MSLTLPTEMQTNSRRKAMEQQTINDITAALGTMRAMLADLQQQVQELKEGREEKKETPPLKPLLEKKEEREESQQQQQRMRVKKAFVKPTPEEVQAYLDQLGETRFTGERFFYYYESRGWLLKKDTPIRSWK